MKLNLRGPGGDRTWTAGVILAGGLYLLFSGLAKGDGFLWPVGGIWVVAGAGLWFWRPWARWVGIGLMAALMAWTVWRIQRHGFRWVQGAQMGLWAWFGWRIWREFTPEPAPEKGDEPMTSMVWLLAETRYLEPRVLAQIAGQAWGGEYALAEGEDDGDTKERCVMGESPHFILLCPEGAFAVHNVPAPYFDKPEEAAKDTRDMRRAKVVREHKAWLSVDLIHAADPNRARASFYPQIARLAAELAGPDCLALLQPETGRTSPWDEALPERLRRPDPLAELWDAGPVPVIRVGDDDPRMAAAVAEARRRWPEFLAALARRREGQHFAIKAPISGGGNTEFIWIEVDGVGGEVVFGKLANDPVELGGLKCGDRVEVPAGDVNDWVYMENEKPVGMFTLPVLTQAARAPRDGAGGD